MNVNANNKFLELKDYSVTGESFELFLDTDLDLLKTIPEPNALELNRYYDSENYISHTDSKRNLLENLYQIVKKVTIKSKLKMIDNLDIQYKTILDIGCGTGDFLLAAKQSGWLVEGYEPNLKAKEIAQVKGLNIVDHLDKIETNSIDVITMWHVLEHVSDLDLQLNTIQRILKKDGIVLIAVPNYKSYDAQYYGKFWAAYDVPRHIWHFSQNSIPRIFSRYGFTLLKKYPMWFDSFYVSLLSEKYKNGKSNFFKSFIIGLKSNFKGLKTSEYSSIIYQLKKM